MVLTSPWADSRSRPLAPNSWLAYAILPRTIRTLQLLMVRWSSVTGRFLIEQRVTGRPDDGFGPVSDTDPYVQVVKHPEHFAL